MNQYVLFSMDTIDKASKLSFSDSLAYGGIMVLIGMVAVFGVLALIMFSLYAFKYFFHDLSNKKKAVPVKEAAPAEIATASVQNDEEIVAAIAAAIAAAESESDGIKFRVVSFKRR